MNGQEPKRPVPVAWYVVLVAAFVFWGLVIIFNVLNLQANARFVGGWLALVGLMLALLIFAGREVNRRWNGVLIDSRYKISLARLQIIMWTVMALSAFLTMALPRSVVGGLDPLTPERIQACVAELQAAATTETAPATTTVASTTTVTATTTVTSTTAAETAALEERCVAEPLNITFPPELVLAMGISAASFAGSNLIKGSKKTKQVNLTAKNAEVETVRQQYNAAQAALAKAKEELQKQSEKVAKRRTTLDEAQTALAAATTDAAKADAQAALTAAQALHEAAVKDRDQAVTGRASAEQAFTEAKEKLDAAVAEVENVKTASQGLLHVNSDAAQARWVDLFRGEEVGNYNLIDMAKVQMFIFTIVVIFAYAVAIAALLQNQTALRDPIGVAFPSFSDSLNTLLAMSHGTYLSVKTADHTETQRS